MPRWEAVIDDDGGFFVLSAVLIANTLDSPELLDAIRSILVERKLMMKEFQKFSVDF